MTPEDIKTIFDSEIAEGALETMTAEDLTELKEAAEAEDRQDVVDFIVAEHNRRAVEEARAELLKALDGNIKQVTAALKGKSPEQLQTLLKAEQDGKTRSGVVDAINALLNPDATKEEKPAKRTVKDIEADLAKAEDGPTDVTNAQLIQRLRAELAEAKGKK